MSILKSIAQALSVDVNVLETAVKRAHKLNISSDNTRLCKLFEKAQRGENITIAAIGGSITEGAWARTNGETGGNNAREYTEILGGQYCYVERVAEWFKSTFPKANINTVNSGIGATPSFLGAFRLDSMILDYNPDLIIVEFSVNDPTAPYLIESEIFDAYEAVVRRSLQSGAAVCQVFTVDENGRGWQYYYEKVGEYYHVPMISYKDAIYPDKCICDWRKISPDGIHPNNAGHAFISHLITSYFDRLLNENENQQYYDIPEKWIHSSTFNQAEMIYARDVERWKLSGELCLKEKVPNVCGKWHKVLVSNGKGKAEIDIPMGAKRIFVLYFNSTGGFACKLNNLPMQYCNTKTPYYEKALWQRVYTGEALENNSKLILETDEVGSSIIIGVLISY